MNQNLAASDFSTCIIALVIGEKSYSNLNLYY